MRAQLPTRVLLGSWLLAATVSSAAPPAASYSMADFPRVDKIDAHMHVHGPADHLVARALRDDFRLLTINCDDSDYPPLDAQRAAAESLRARYPGRVAWAATFPVTGFGAPGWADRVVADLAGALRAGAVGVKVWKNIGMELRDADGVWVMPDDSRLEPIFSFLEREHVVLLGHQAEPLNCWLPFAQMTVRSDRTYFREHPQYYMALHPEMPSHDAILAARDRMLGAHPALRFDGMHLASLEWDVDALARFLDRFPDARVDMAARLVHLEYQATTQRDKVRRFLIKYQDRVLYASDDSYGPGDDDPAAVADIHRDWVEGWRFLATGAAMHSSDFTAGFHGLALPREVIDKIYRRNAEALFPGAWSRR